MSSVYVSAVTALEEFITLWGIGADDAILTKKLNLVDCATECSAIPECNAFKTRAQWCILQQRAGLHRRCEQFDCDRMYIKKTYSSESLRVYLFIKHVRHTHAIRSLMQLKLTIKADNMKR